VYGASGGNGTFAVQIADALGAEVTAVSSCRNMELVRSLGAQQVLDYTEEGFGLEENSYDLILGCAGYRPIREYKAALKPRGIYLSVGGAMKQVNEGLLKGPMLSERKGKKLLPLYARSSQADLVQMKELIETGKVKPVIDRIFPLEQTVDALRYYSEGHTRGKVVITMT
jgi:NADPH:quinone reductase-like Zn-dependent oxidoreductase